MSQRSNKPTDHRLLEPIGYVPPVEYEAMYYQQQVAPVMVAGIK